MSGENGFYMPGEWERHERTLIEWPVRESLVWPDHYKEVCEGYAAVAKAVSEFETVTVIVNPKDRAEAKRICGSFAEILEIPHNDAWCRDNGPTFLKNSRGELRGINWKFNAWGEKYKPYALDNEAALKILNHYKVPVTDVPLVLEGGSIHVDGEGTLLTTKQCLLHPNRNPGLSREQIEEKIKANLSIRKIIWLNNGLFGDETDGHVDNVACFARPGLVLIQTCRDERDPNYKTTMENLDILKTVTDAKGRSLEVIEILQPPVRFYKGIRLTLSYLNFYFVNGGIILPVFGKDAKKTDQMTGDILKEVFPGRKIVKVDGMPLIKEGGNVHCITQQMPEGFR